MADPRSRFSRHRWIPVTEGHSGAGVWRLEGRPTYYVKIAERSAHPDSGFDLVAETERLRWLAGRGLPVPEVVDSGPTWLVTTAVPGRPASAAWPAERLAGVVDALADITRTLHQLPVANCPFDRSLAVTMPHARQAAVEGLIDLADLDQERRGWDAGRLLSTLEATRPAVEEVVVCHGDLCLPNVLLDPETLRITGLIDLGRLGIADRYADLALATRSLRADDLNPQFRPEHADRFLARYGESPVDAQRLEFYRLLDEFF
jgi:kanamycin kinase/aminoglycoside 3'-phosphotransferase-2